ncbi:MAG: hypothetical protein KC635_07985 [Myxococcales bacterium]|nr:hypothetical protein [Myxococcales bacterium]MCB9733256.1 hypothetical protein [Deltaproteobacteria bacterium]
MADERDDANVRVRDEEVLGTYAQWVAGYSPESVARAMHDQAALRRGQMNDGNEYNRTVPSGPSERHYDKLRTERDDLDYREWNSDTGFSGVNRWPTGPGMQTDQQKRRRAARKVIDEGF